MRTPLITGAAALAERMTEKAQVDASLPAAPLPPYLEMLLAHLRLLIGVPFEYLVPDSRLLPDESIRFFYLDRSWTDRLVDGVLAVGKTGTREQAHHQAHAADIQATLDRTEPLVRGAQLQQAQDRTTATAGIVSGLLLRSAAVSGWPAMDVRAFSEVVPAPPQTGGEPEVEAWRAAADRVQLPTLRLERPAPAVLLAMFAGVPKLVWFEEPHHGLAFTFRPQIVHGGQRELVVDRHTASGGTETPAAPVVVPVRAANRRVIAVQELCHRLGDPQLVTQIGSAALAIECMNHPWRQRFQGSGGGAGGAATTFAAGHAVAARVADAGLRSAVQGLVP